MSDKGSFYDNFNLLVDGKEAFPEILECIGCAKKRIEINMFIWREDNIGIRLAEAVLAAADRGVEVFIEKDRYGAVLEAAEETGRSFFHKRLTLSEKIKVFFLKLLYPKNLTRMGDCDGNAEDLLGKIVSHKNISLNSDSFKADHSKYYIIDDEILFLGGINIEDKENGCDSRGIVYGDYMVKITGEKYIRAFRKKMAEGEDVSEDYAFAANIKRDKLRLFEMKNHYLDIINDAKRELHITMAYFSPVKSILKAIRNAGKRGVAVTVMIPASANFQNDLNYKTAKKLLKLTRGGINLLLSPKMLHTKLVMTEKFISFGSCNITKKAFRQLSELNLTVKNEDSAFRTRLLLSTERNSGLSTLVTDARELKYNRFLAFLEGFLV